MLCVLLAMVLPAAAYLIYVFLDYHRIADDQPLPVASCRNADGPIRDGQLRLTVDGFLVSENVEVLSSEVIDLEFAFSDHNPVKLTFLLKEE